MKQIFSLAALVLAVTTSAFAAGNLEQTDNPDLIYDPQTGNVMLEPSAKKGGGKIIGFVLINDSGLFRPTSDETFRNNTPWEEGELTDPDGNPFDPPRFVMDNTSKQIGSADLSFKGGKNTINLGNIFPTGLDVRGLFNLLSKAEVSWATGASGKGVLDICGMCPEPGGSALLGPGLVAALGVMRRRRSGVFAVVSAG